MKRYIYLGLFSLFTFNSNAQSVDKISELNGVSLGSSQAEYAEDLFLISGDEPAYQEAPSLQFSLKRKIRLGIRDASYLGNNYRKFGNYEATNITMQFYEGKLFKAQWTFRNRENLMDTYNFLVDTYADKFGASKEEVFDEFRQVEWAGKSHYVQVFMDPGSDVTLVYEDVKIAKRVQKVLTKSK